MLRWSPCDKIWFCLSSLSCQTFSAAVHDLFWGREGQTTQRKIHVHSNYRKQAPILNPWGKHYNFGSILFIPSQKEMNGPTSRWIHCESSNPPFPPALPLAKESQKFLPQPWVRAAHLSAWSIQEQLTSMIIFHSVVKPFPLHSWRALTLYFLLCQPFKPKTPGRPSAARGARHL